MHTMLSLIATIFFFQIYEGVKCLISSDIMEFCTAVVFHMEMEMCVLNESINGQHAVAVVRSLENT